MHHACGIRLFQVPTTCFAIPLMVQHAMSTYALPSPARTMLLSSLLPLRATGKGASRPRARTRRPLPRRYGFLPWFFRLVRRSSHATAPALENASFSSSSLTTICLQVSRCSCCHDRSHELTRLQNTRRGTPSQTPTLSRPQSNTPYEWND